MDSELQLSPFDEVLDDFRQGRMVILADDAHRENEGDLTIATECVTPEVLNFMTTQARGLICVSMSSEIAQRLDLPLQVLNNNSAFNTPFTISIDHRSAVGSGVTTSARCHTMKRLIASDATPEEFVSPGHVFPLIAHAGGVTGRQGQTEGSYDLARIAGFQHSGVICEILNPDGTMARGRQLNEFAQTHRLKVSTVAEIIRYRVQKEVLVRKVAERTLDTAHGRFLTSVFEDDVEGKEHLVLQYGEITPERLEKGVLVRIHSECLTGDVFGSRRCDCGPQLSQSLDAIVHEGAGMVLYLRQEGRGIGLLNKLRAYELQDLGHDTVDANIKLGFAPDHRDFAVAANILTSFSVNRVRLLTNNPQKLETLKRLGITVVDRIPVVVAPDELSNAYLATKREKMGHLL